MTRHMSPARRRRILEAHGHACGQCGSEAAPFEIDHKHALALGGEDTDDNLWPLCVPCHKAKTGGTRATSYGSDKHAIAKVKRIRRRREERKRRRPWSRWRRKMDGTVVRP